jgi:sugar-specific transcriptional regulator TrmB
LEHQFSKLLVLIDLGLTKVQARLYLALVKSGSSRISAISKISKVARPETYRNLSKLQKLGLVEKIVKVPVEYKAAPLKEGLSLLLKAKTKHYERVRSEVKMLRSTAEIEKPDKKKQEESPDFVLVPESTVVQKIKTAIEKAQLSIDVVLSWKRFSRGIASTFAESIEVAWAKNVKCRFIIQNHLKSKTAEQLVQFCREKPCCQIRFIHNQPKTIFGIYDKKEISVIAFSKTDLPDSPSLWSKNSSLIALGQECFERLWLKATS